MSFYILTIGDEGFILDGQTILNWKSSDIDSCSLGLSDYHWSNNTIGPLCDKSIPCELVGLTSVRSI